MTIQRTIIGSCLVLLLVFLGRVVIEHKNDKLSADSWQDRIKDKLQDGAKDKRRARFNRFRNNNDKDKAGAYYGYWDIIGRNQKKKKNNGGLVERYPASWGSIEADRSLSWGMDSDGSGSSKNNYKTKESKPKEPKPPKDCVGPGCNPQPQLCPDGSYPPCNTECIGSNCKPETNYCPDGSLPPCVSGPNPDQCWVGEMYICTPNTLCPPNHERKNGECVEIKYDEQKLCSDGSNPPCELELVETVTPVVKIRPPSGSYLTPPVVTIEGVNTERIRYCIGYTSSGTCCDPGNGALYTNPFPVGTGNGLYCVAAIGFAEGTSSATDRVYYEVDENLVSMTLDLPEKSYFQTQQLNKSMTVDSQNFRSPAHTFLQVATTTDPGADACEALNYTSPVDEMMTSLGISVVNFATVEDPFQIPMELTNKMTYGTNFLISAMERQGAGGAEYKCMKNTIYVWDFHLESQTASAYQPTPTDGTYTFQGGLNSYGSFGDNGEAVGSGGNTLEHGFLNIIN